jgi:hypothetical protein
MIEKDEGVVGDGELTFVLLFYLPIIYVVRGGEQFLWIENI